MTHTITRTAVAGALLLACGFAQSAAAQTAYGYNGDPYAQPRVYHSSRALTVNRHYAPVAPAYDPYRGPQAVVTAPLAAAATLVALPFRVVNGIFPPYGDPAQNPLVLVGAPVHAAGQVAQFPIRVLQAPFGGYDYQPY